MYKRQLLFCSMAKSFPSLIKRRPTWKTFLTCFCFIPVLYVDNTILSFAFLCVLTMEGLSSNNIWFFLRRRLRTCLSDWIDYSSQSFSFESIKLFSSFLPKNHYFTLMYVTTGIMIFSYNYMKIYYSHIQMHAFGPIVYRMYSSIVRCYM